MGLDGKFSFWDKDVRIKFKVCIRLYFGRLDVKFVIYFYILYGIVFFLSIIEILLYVIRLDMKY